jgi:hypothetical protein
MRSHMEGAEEMMQLQEAQVMRRFMRNSAIDQRRAAGPCRQSVMGLDTSSGRRCGTDRQAPAPASSHRHRRCRPRDQVEIVASGSVAQVDAQIERRRIPADDQ